MDILQVYKNVQNEKPEKSFEKAISEKANLDHNALKKRKC
jgi:hypothetical protein